MVTIGDARSYINDLADDLGPSCSEQWSETGLKVGCGVINGVAACSTGDRLRSRTTRPRLEFYNIGSFAMIPVVCRRRTIAT